MSLLKILDLDQYTDQDEEIVIHGFMDRYEINYEDAKDIFIETKKWLWLASKGQEQNKNLMIDRPLLIIDEMWHTFILHTNQYYSFCMKNFHRFIHHVPTQKSFKKKNKSKISEEVTIENYEESLNDQYSFIYDNLGPETLLKWYDRMAEKYTPEYINSIKK